MKIIRNGVEIELTNAELRQAHDEYTRCCRIEDVSCQIYESFGFFLNKEENKNLLNSIAERAENFLSKNDGYYEHFWDSVAAAIDENKESIFLAQKSLTPSQFLLAATGKDYSDIKSLDDILDVIEAEDLGLWDYPIDEIDEASQNNEYLLLVEFNDGSKRIFEANEEMMEKADDIQYNNSVSAVQHQAEPEKPNLSDLVESAAARTGVANSNSDIKNKEPDFNL